MLNEYKATLKNGQITWLDTPPNSNDSYDITIIVNERPSEKYDPNKKGERRWGFLEGQAIIPDDIDWTEEEVTKLFGIK